MDQQAVHPVSTSAIKRAEIWRMVMPQHVCPFGLKALWLLKRRGFEVEDHWITTRGEQEAFKVQHDVKTTPQVFIDGRRVGGHDDLRRLLGLPVKDPKAVSYVPVMTVFGVAAALTLAMNLAAGDRFDGWFLGGRFIAIAMCLLAMLKLQDVDRFATMFLGYDLLARRYPPYAYVYPFAELCAGALMLAGAARWLAAPVSLFIGVIGAASVFKAVYIDKRELRCACVGGSSNVPLGFVSLTENLMMVAMGIAMLVL